MISFYKLLTASLFDHLQAVDCLVQLGADVNHGHGLATPLCLACKLNNEAMVLYLIAKVRYSTLLYVCVCYLSVYILHDIDLVA